MGNSFTTEQKSGQEGAPKSRLLVPAINTAALNWGIRRVVTPHARALQDLATRSWEIHPEETHPCPTAIHLPETLDRISGLSPWRTWETEQAFINGGNMTHAATQAHLIENVTVSDAFVYKGASKMKAGFGPQRLIRRHNAPFEHFKEAHLVSNMAGSHFFGMFMRAVLPMELLPDDAATKISLASKFYGHEAEYRDLLSLPKPHVTSNARIERMIFYTDFGQNTSKLERYTKIRQNLRRNAGAERSGAPGIYLKRGATGDPRLITNEAEVEATLTAMGFEVIEQDSLGSADIARRMLDTPIVVTIEGSHMAHAVYTLAEGGTLLALQPPDRFALAFKEFTDRAGLRFAFMVGDPASGGFRVDIDDLKRTLDLVGRKQAQALV